MSAILHGADGSCRIQIHERGKLRSSLGFHRELVCANQAEYDALIEFLIGARVPFMVGHMTPGASDAACFWLQDQGRRIDYLELSYGGKTEWSVREIVDDAKAWRGVKLDELLGPEVDLFDPANRTRLLGRQDATPSTKATKPQPVPAPAPGAPVIEVAGTAATASDPSPTPGFTPAAVEPETPQAADEARPPPSGMAAPPGPTPAAPASGTPEPPAAPSPRWPSGCPRSGSEQRSGEPPGSLPTKCPSIWRRFSG